MPDNDNKWLARVPDLDGGRRFPSLDPAPAKKLFDELLAADDREIMSVIGTLHEIDDGQDWKARFVLGALASHVGSPDRAAARTKLGDLYAAALGHKRPASVKTFLVMQLQRFAGAPGGRSVDGDAADAGAVPVGRRVDEVAIDALVGQLAANEPALVDAAAAALTAIGKPAEKALKRAANGSRGHAEAAINHALLQIERMA